MTDKRKSDSTPENRENDASSDAHPDPPSADRRSDVAVTVEGELPTRASGILSKMSSMSGVESQPSVTRVIPKASFPGFADMVEMETVQRLSKSLLYPSDLIELVKSRDLSKFYEAQKAVEEMQPTTGKAEMAHLPLEDIMDKFGLTDMDQGLSDSQVALNKQLYGSNALDLGKKDPLWKIFLNQFKSFVILLLFIAAIASLALQNYFEGGFIIFIVTVNALLATYMERSAANVLEKLAALSSPTTTVIRNNTEVVIMSTEVVPGDVVVLKTGDTVVADLRLFEVMEIRINESLLTGESVDVKKSTVAEDMETPFSTNLCFASTNVVSGYGKGIVYNTGMNTQVGKIANQLKKASETSKMTPLQRGLNRLGGTIGIISTMVLITIVIVAILTGFDDPTRPNTNRTLSIVLLAVGFAASSIPEGLPMVVTISLSMGAKDMAKENANVLKLPAVETLGCCSVVCSDKTGTLTEGKMVTTDLVLFYNEGSEKNSKKPKEVKSRRLMFYPTLGFNPKGGLFDPKDLTDSFKEKLVTMYKRNHDFSTLGANIMSSFSSFKSLSKSGSSEEMKRVPEDPENYSASVMSRTIMAVGYLNSYNTKLVLDDSNKWTCVGNMTECPLVVAATKCGHSARLFEAYPRVDTLEVPFNSKRKLSVTVHKLNQENYFEDLQLVKAGKTFTHVAMVKGAPDVLRPYCRYVVATNEAGFRPLSTRSFSFGSRPNLGEQVSKPLCMDFDNCEPLSGSEETADVVMDMNDMLSNSSLRVIMLGLVPLTKEDIEHLEKLEDSEYRQEYILSESAARKPPRDSKTKSGNDGKLVLLGITGSLDPPRPGVKESIKTCKTAGVRVIMITGDQKATAVSIAKKISLISSNSVTFDSTPEINYTGNTPTSTSDVNHPVPSTDGNKSGSSTSRTTNSSSSNPSESTNPVLKSSLKTKDFENTVEPVVQDKEQLMNEDLGIECNRLHINSDPSMDYLPDDQIDEITARYNVFCRAQPEDKVVIVNSLKRQGEVTAMTGDGVNDAAALKTADIGISMGINGTDVAKGASEVVLLDDNFCTIVKAIHGGRTIYANIQKFVSFLLGTNVGEILYLTTSIIISTLPPVEALQILFLNFLTDGCPAVALSREPADDDTMRKPPRKRNSPIMTRDWWLFGNLPHTVFEAAAVIAAILIALYLCTGVLTLKELNAQCKYVSMHDKDGNKSDFVYFCKSYEYRVTYAYTGWVTNIDYYDPYEGKMKSFMGAAKGRVETLKTSDPGLHPILKNKFDLNNTDPLAHSFEDMVAYLEVDENGWIRSNGKQKSDDEVLYGVGKRSYKDVVGRKSTQARTLSFITAVWAEMLRAYTVRSWEYFHRVFNRNPWMHVACSISATVTFALTIIPGLSTILHVSSLTCWQYLLSIALAFLTLVLDEYVTKVIYHRVKRTKKSD